MENVDLIAEKIANEAIKIATSGKKLPDEFELAVCKIKLEK